MLAIRQDQMAAMAQVSRRRFADEMTAHLFAHAPRLAALRGTACIREVVDTGLHRAGGYAFSLRGPLRLYLELMFALGCDFDTDPQHAWAQAILAEESGAGEMVRADRLYAATCDYFREVVGPGSQHAVQALERVLARGSWPLSEEPADASSPGRIAAMLRETYPHKYRFVGDDAIARLVDEGMRNARNAGLGSERGAAVFTALMFGFGHGVAADPLYPWVRHTLDRAQPPAERLDSLSAKTLHYVRGMLAHLGS